MFIADADDFEPAPVAATKETPKDSWEDEDVEEDEPAVPVQSTQPESTTVMVAPPVSETFAVCGVSIRPFVCAVKDGEEEEEKVGECEGRRQRGIA